jgi:hypothetical protein
MKRPIAALTAVVILASVLGCAQEEESIGAGRLSDSMAPAQLLRVEAYGRVPAYMIKTTAEANERSQSCDTSDPKGLERFWRSSVEIYMVDNASVQPKAIVDELVASFVAQDWVAAEGTSSLNTVLTKEALSSTISLTRTPMDTGGTITIAVDGPCVMTAGQEDPAVRKLDGRPS